MISIPAAVNCKFPDPSAQTHVVGVTTGNTAGGGMGCSHQAEGTKGEKAGRKSPKAKARTIRFMLHSLFRSNDPNTVFKFILRNPEQQFLLFSQLLSESHESRSPTNPSVPVVGCVTRTNQQSG
jgi:hypothetical protein